MGVHERSFIRRREQIGLLERCVTSWTPRERSTEARHRLDQDAAARQRFVAEQCQAMLKGLPLRAKPRMMEIRRRVA